jgi:hypothetical protein
MTPREIKHGSPRTNSSAVTDVDEPTSKDLIDGGRVLALQTLDRYQAQTKAWRDNTVVPKEFNKGDLILVRTTRTESRGKLEPKWEGPFIVKTKASPSACRLVTPSGEDLEHSSNIDNLQKFFCWGLVLKCYELRTRQHKMLNVNALRPLKHYSLKDLMNFGRRLRVVQLRRLNLRN